jgi:hypothetical protein
VDTTSPAAWETLLTLLSLDSVTPFFDDLGFPLQNRTRFIELIRGLIVGWSKEPEANRGKRIANPDQLLGELDREFGPDQSRLFLHWARMLYVGGSSENRPWTTWDHIFGSWSNGRLPSMPRLPPAVLKSLQDGFQDAVLNRGVDDKIESLKRGTLSNWDLEMYARHGYNPYDDLADPFLSVSLMVDMSHFQQFWKGNVEPLSQQLKDSLLRDGRSTTEELKMNLPVPLQLP